MEELDIKQSWGCFACVLCEPIKLFTEESKEPLCVIHRCNRTKDRLYEFVACDGFVLKTTEERPDNDQ